MASVSQIAAFILSLWVVALVDGLDMMLGLTHREDGADATPSMRNGLSRSNARVKNAERQLLPHHHPPGPPHPPHSTHESSHYKGCLGLSEEEREEAWKFHGPMSPCEILVDGEVVVSAEDDDSTGSSSGGSSSGGGGGPGGSSSGSGGNGGGSSSNNDDDGSSSNGNSGNSGGGSGGSNSGSNNNSNNDSGGSSSNGGSSDGGGNDDDGSGSSSGNVDGSDGKDNRDGYDDDDGNNGGGNGGNGDDDNASGDGGGDHDSGGDDDDYLDNPLQYFDITDCGTFSHIWVWDLALSCGETYSSSLENCECTSAQILFQYGEIECPGGVSDAPSCPDGCPVCNTCMQLLGCDEVQGSDHGLPTSITTAAFPIIFGIVAAVATTVMCVSIYQYRHRRSVESRELKADFFGGEPPLNRML